MPDYSKSKIYKIINDVNDEIYVGSTIRSLCRRMESHRRDHTDEKRRPNSKLFKLMREIGTKQFKIILIENYACQNKEELRAREQYYIDLLKPSLNVYHAVLDVEARKEKHKVYRKKYTEQKIICDCGSIYSRRNKADHYKTAKHKNYIKSDEYIPTRPLF
jgi:group I intron endonuclease